MQKNVSRQGSQNVDVDLVEADDDDDVDKKHGMGFLLGEVGEVGPWRIDNYSIHRIETEESTSP